MSEDPYAAQLAATVRDWVRREHPQDPELAERAGRVAAGLYAEGASLGEVCRAAYAYVVHHERLDRPTGADTADAALDPMQQSPPVA